MQLLITRPRYDKPTHYLFHWAGDLIREAKSRRVKVVDLEKEKAIKSIFHSYLRKNAADVVIINGHGNEYEVAGHDGEIILAIDDGVHLLKDKNVFIRACNCGENLGVEIIKAGARGFIGYNQPFIFPFNRESVGKPMEDELAKPLLECSNQVGISLIKGNSIKKAQEDSMKKYEEKRSELLSTKTPDTYILPFLNWNMISQVCYEQSSDQ
ncbi:hypothetical protein A2333_02525 [Candidatus Wolfebacteria bacterium RIFOXYB2_FULL_49_7]|uniref:CHAT domain-containing protein n=1 Tax=Candidatus Wolfebacteria bacterium RIFOXYB1_FULL_54_12 TaxID=1802559 RepID=A0A1F8DWL2_9BACT|nr:MAG: hypothetical protein A2372_00035 [Candidatus Wolfebacteria bacterium RIFOXYB1_FULL_54_12]OGM96568.1 MAG: hypothetical protein A2333_02525 [Candidatus Wolfebacteria bacterium RIFOXYB2_FULL_49_7]